MNTPAPDHANRGKPSDADAPAMPIEPEAGAPAAKAADELLSHGLLAFVHRDHRDSQEQRIARVLDAIESGSAAPSVLRTLFNWRTGSALAACIAIIAALAVFGVPGESSGLATVQRSIAAMRTNPGDRRFEIRTQGWDETELSTEVRGTVDTRAPGLVLLRVPAMDDHTVIVGADAQGRWAIRHDGGIERRRVEPAWPRFATIGDESLFADSVDRILAQAARYYDLMRKPDEVLEGHGERALERIRGLRRRDARLGPDVMDIWINPDTRIAERVQFTWDPQPQPPMDLGVPPEPRGPGPGPQDDRPRRAGNEGRPFPPDSDGPPSTGERRPFADGPGHRQRPPRGEHEEPRPDGANPGIDRAGPEDRDDRPRPRGPRGDGPSGHPRPGPGGFPLGPIGPRPMGPPHRVLRLDRVDPPEFREGWFSPETHAR
ncbi:MAG: hypothetical protein IT438_14305 [Phycisphaerales bacterium]|nr:hypothetical protein [Phycisphaerales bacterium]